MSRTIRISWVAALDTGTGMTAGAVSANGLEIKCGIVHPDGDFTYREKPDVSKNAPVGIKTMGLSYSLETDATEDQILSLVKRTESYFCCLPPIRQKEIYTAIVQR